MFKKIILTFALTGVLLTTNAQAASTFPEDGDEFLSAIAMWLPNLVLDTWDIFTVQVGAGPVIGLEGRLTRYGQLGAMAGTSYIASKAWNRQLGLGQETGMDFSVGPFTTEIRSVKNATRGLQEYDYEKLDIIPLPSEEIYNYFYGSRDIWECGIEGALLVHVKAGVHPLEIIDLVAGIFFIDIRGDNMTLSEIGAQ